MRYAIIQSGKIGDLWLTVNLADALHLYDAETTVVYDERHGDVFEFFPSVKAMPVPFKHWFKNEGFGHAFNEAVWQIYWVIKMELRGYKVIWNQVYPFRWLHCYLKKMGFADYWYRKYSLFRSRRPATTLEVKDEGIMLVIPPGGSELPQIEFYHNMVFAKELFGQKVIVIHSDDRSHCLVTEEIWEGSFSDYQQLVASCSLVFGEATSAHVLGQLLGKKTVAIYKEGTPRTDFLGGETVRLIGDEVITDEQLEKLV